MNSLIASIVAELDSHIGVLQAAKEALLATAKGTKTVPTSHKSSTPRRTMSVASRKKIAAAARRRWKERRAKDSAAKKAAKTT